MLACFLAFKQFRFTLTSIQVFIKVSKASPENFAMVSVW
jgi:hypothetical protein